MNDWNNIADLWIKKNCNSFWFLWHFEDFSPCILALKHLYAVCRYLSDILHTHTHTHSTFKIYIIYLLGKQNSSNVNITHIALLYIFVLFYFKYPVLKKCVCMLMIINAIFRTCGACNLHTELNVSDNWEILHRNTPWQPLETDRSILPGLLQQYIRLRQHTSKWMWHAVWGETP